MQKWIFNAKKDRKWQNSAKEHLASLKKCSRRRKCARMPLWQYSGSQQFLWKNDEIGLCRIKVLRGALSRS